MLDSLQTKISTFENMEEKDAEPESLRKVCLPNISMPVYHCKYNCWLN